VDLSALATYGTGGVILALILSKQIVPGWIYKKAQQDLDRLQSIYETQVIPNLAKSNEVLDKLITTTTEVRLPAPTSDGVG
jgi:hypothetical protein